MMDPTIRYLATANDTASWPAPANIVAVDVGTAAATAIVTVYNGTATTDPVVAVIDASVNGTHHFDGARCPKGLFVKLTTANAKVSVIGF